MTNDDALAFVGTYTDAEDDGVFGFRADGNGELQRTDAVPAGPDPSFLAVDSGGDHLYAATRPDDGSRIVAFAVDREGGTLTRLNDAPTNGGDSPCHCTVDATDSSVLVAHYFGRTVSVLPIEDDGRIGRPTATVEHVGSGPNEDRQSTAHPHSVEVGPDNRYAYVPDLGADRVFVYDFDPDAGALEPAACGHVDVHAGAGPRHLDFHPSGRYAYLINELDSTIVAFEREPTTGALDAFATVDTLPTGYDGENATAEVQVHPSGEYLYGSNRGHDSVAAFELDGDGRPTLLATESIRGEWPRHFAIHPDGGLLYAENAESDTIVTFRIGNDGTLEYAGYDASVPSPVCMTFVP